MKTQILLFCLLGLSLAKTAYAEETNFGKRVPTTAEVIDALKPATDSPDISNQNTDDEDAPKSSTPRSIDMSGLKTHLKKVEPKEKPTISSKVKAKAKIQKAHKAKQGHQDQDEEKESNKQQGTALSMELLFGYNSAELTEDTKNKLKPVGEAMVSNQLQNVSFIVEGHTDAIGGDAYNKSLSEQRAAAVKLFLVDTYHIDASRIQVVGKGKSDLLDPKNPDSEVNRRVRIVVIK